MCVAEIIYIVNAVYAFVLEHYLQEYSPSSCSGVTMAEDAIAKGKEHLKSYQRIIYQALDNHPVNTQPAQSLPGLEQSLGAVALVVQRHRSWANGKIDGMTTVAMAGGTTDVR